MQALPDNLKGDKEMQQKEDLATTTTVMTPGDWQDCWNEGRTGWTEQSGNMLLKQHLNLLSKRCKSLVVFFPLCGDAIEMKWIYDLGHTVVGAEFHASALQQFYDQHGLPYSVRDVADGVQLYESTDRRLRLYACDIYNFRRVNEKPFDCIWDRGSFVAINRADRDNYAQLLVSLMAPDCLYLLCVVEYDPSQYPGPPHSVTEAEVRCHYEGVGCLVKLVDAREAMEEKYKRWGMPDLQEKLYSITTAGEK